ncbi:MAG: type II toxin-antitoxin system RelE/ParE family toxin [Bacteroidota bacterium]
MNVSVVTTDYFRREAKKLLKKYRSLKQELQELIEELGENPRIGIRIGDDTYKIRLAVKSRGRGKSGGMRIITYIDVEVELEEQNHTVVYLISIYDKSERSNISDSDIKRLIDEIQDIAAEEDEDS